MAALGPTPPPEQIRAAIQARSSWGLEALRRLVSVDSVAPHEAAAQETLAGLLRAEGLEPELLPLDAGDLREAAGFIETDLPLGDRPNLRLRWGEGGIGRRSLALNSHIDTVSWNEAASQWSVDPLGAAVRDGHLYGRGAVDAKGQVMAAVMALMVLRDLGYEPPGQVVLQSVVDEEPGGNGTLAACLAGPPVDAAIVLEPTDGHVAYGHRGILGLRFSLEGAPGHGAVAGVGESAVLSASRLALALSESLQGWMSDTDAVWAPPSVNVGRIEGGEDIFSTPERCVLECGVRYAPGSVAAVQEHIAERLAVAWGEPLDDAVFVHFDAAAISPARPLASGLLDAVRTVDPTRGLATFPGGCDARHFVNRFYTPTVIFGPGQLSAAHAVDEALPLASWLSAVESLALFITRWCQ